MTLEEIKSAVESGKRVFWSNRGYEVIKDPLRDGSFQWLIIYRQGTREQNCIGLTWQDNVTVNGKPEEFFIA